MYRDEHGNIIPEDELQRLLSEQGDHIEFKTVYETQTKILKPGEELPPGAKKMAPKQEEGEVPVYPKGQNPETVDEKGEKKPYRTA